MADINKLTEDLAYIQKLGDNPNTDNGLSSDELKAMFDKAPLAIQKYINEVLIPAVAKKKHNHSVDDLSDGTDTLKKLLEMGYLVLNEKQYGPSFPADAPDGTLFFIPLEAVSS